MENQVSVQKFGVNTGVIYGGISILTLFITYSQGENIKTVLSIVSLVILIGLLYYAITDFKKKNGILTLSNAIKIGLITGVIGGLIYAVYQYLHYTVIDPDFIIEMKETAVEEVERTFVESNASTEEKDAAYKGLEIFTSPFTLATLALFGQMLKSFIIGLVLGLIFKNNQQDY
ncbi:DUF4199 domain-containing protein [Psychroflexus maritimus]|uniref:DUF4199 domain-containing protein n=1 Tax=Psychroflexus maritimus TaxID=2714865 RepID=A0A967AB18_9FLAO|nr:DUF4199 domain-containing protein [Psychroflexus maritimus]NGZ88751.1 DUF4199 domain-containing protein [Psychroflexus maritimus]